MVIKINIAKDFIIHYFQGYSLMIIIPSTFVLYFMIISLNTHYIIWFILYSVAALSTASL